jgi:hypothetical protein
VRYVGQDGILPTANPETVASVAADRRSSMLCHRRERNLVDVATATNSASRKPHAERPGDNPQKPRPAADLAL